MKIELKLEGMTCLDCAHTLKRALGAVPGVASASVSYGARRATVTAADDITVDRLLHTVEEAGYRAEVLGDAGHGTASATSPKREAPAGKAAARARKDDSDGAYDLVIIGSGSAGMSAAIRASELGATVAIVEAAEVVGGTCVNVGCIPSKHLVEAAHHYHLARTGHPGMTACDSQLAWDEVLRQKRAVVDGLRKEKYLAVLDAYEGVTLLRGRATLLGGGRVRVEERELAARKVVIATGTRPSVPPIPGLRESGALNSTSVMELDLLPGSMIVIGGGSIGLELGQAFHRFGVRVIVVEALDRILPNEDADVSAALAAALEAEGLEIHTGARVTTVERSEQGYTVSIERGSLRGALEAEQLLVATGRRPNSEELGLDAAGVSIDQHGFITVDEFMRTTNPDIHAAGDVTGGPGYVYVAALQGGIAAQAALAERGGQEAIPIDLAAVPRVTFTDPQVAAVGMTEVEAREAGLDPLVTSLPVRYLPRAAVSYRQHGVIKLIAERGTDRLLGAHLVAPNAGDVIGEAVLAVRFGLTTRDLVSTLHPYLTWSEGLKLAAQTFTKDIARLSCCA